MNAMRALDLDQITAIIGAATKPVNVLWQTRDSIAFVARGRAGRSEFHVDPSDEVMYMIRGDMNLHYRDARRREKVAVIREGEILHCPAGTPHCRASRPTPTCWCSSASGGRASRTASSGTARRATRRSTRR